MNKITFPMTRETRGQGVADLQDGLRLLLDKSFFQLSDADRQAFAERLRAERAETNYGSATRKMVAMFQERRQLEPRGDVDERTASALNEVLEALGAFTARTPDEQRLVAGQVRREDGLPFEGGLVRAFHVAERGILRLGEDTTDTEGHYTIRYAPLPGGGSTDLRVVVSDVNRKPLRESDVIGDAKPIEVIDLVVPATEGAAARRVLEGRIVSEDGLPAEGLSLRLYHRDFGGAETLLNQTDTREHGLYTLSYDTGRKPASLEVRAVDAGGNEISLSKTLYDRDEDERKAINLVAPAKLNPLEAEYQRLAGDLVPHVGDMMELAKARENTERQDLTVLNRATGWDARVIALAANASKLSSDPQVGLSQEALYGLLRAGLPNDKLQLANVSGEAVGQALSKAREAGIVSLSDEQVDEAKAQFQTFSREARLAVPAPGSRATYGELLRSAGLSDDARAKFATVYLNHRVDPAQLWKDAKEAGIEDNDIENLQRQGKLAYLTLNNPAMITHLQQNMAVNDPVQLVDQDLFRAENWKAEVLKLAGAPPDTSVEELPDENKKKLRALIPQSYEGATVKDSLNAYADDMARKVRLSYPTHVVRRMVEQDINNEFKLGNAAPLAATFLRKAAANGFKLGQTTVESFVKTHPDALAGIAPDDIEATKHSVKTLQRVYQITPSNEAMPVLLSLGLTSAYDVVAMSRDSFLDRYSHLFPSPEQAKLVYRKAEQVSSVTYNLFTIARGLDSTPQVYGISAPADRRENARNKLIKQFPTMEALFGSLDFCECEHCRSVLSPAAYLVDLLQFIDADEPLWNNFLEDWKKKHSGQQYTAKYKKPYDAIIERRPDLPHIQLTCENTHTALPYIDVVNEILEYYVANNTLRAEAANDTGDATTPELLAEPQHILPAAYDALAQARYPLSLPFDLWLEAVRSFCDHFETPLWRLLEVFRSGDELYAPTQSFDRAAIFAERLGLSPTEYAIFTDPHALDRWYELYGYKKASDATTEAEDPDTGQRIDLNSAKALSRRLGVTYKELLQIVSTGFVNPRLEGMVVLHKLGVTVSDVMFYKKHKILLGQDESALSVEDQRRLAELKAFEQRLDDLSKKFQSSGFNARTWLNEALRQNTFDDILVLADTSANCNFDKTILRFASDKPADGVAFLKINLFVRLWRKLNWTIEELDRALQAFVPQNTPFDKDHLDKSPLKTALLYLAHLKTLDEQVPTGKDGRLKLITLWSQIASSGKNPLYAQLFLTPSILKSDAVFDDALGNYLSPAGVEAMAQSHKHEVSLEDVAPADKIDPADFAGQPKISLRYDAVGRVQHLAYQGILADADKVLLSALSLSPSLAKLLDAVQAKAREFTLVKGHLLALQGALQVTPDDISRVLADAGESIDEAELSLANVSLLFRYVLLAKAMKLSIQELISLRQLSGLDPFKPLITDPVTKLTVPVTKLDENYPLTQTLRFVEVAEQAKGSGLSIQDLDYLLRHRFDPAVAYRPNREAVLALMKTLAEGIRAIRAEHAVPDDPGSMTEEALRQKLGLALPPDVVARFLSMLNGTVEFTATRPGVEEVDRLKPALFADEPSIREVSYNPTRKEQKLTFRGVLFDAREAQLTAKFTSPVFAALLDDVQGQARTFFAKHLLKQDSTLQPASGFLDAAAFDLLFGPTLADANDGQQQERLRQQRARLAQAFLPFLQQRLIHQFIVQTMTAQTGADRSLVEALLTDALLLGDPQSLLASFTALGARGVNVTFFASADGSGGPLSATLFADADTALKSNPPRPSGTNSVRFEGYLEVPTSGAYRFYAAVGKKDAEAELRFDHLPEPLFKRAASSDGAELSEFLELKSGVPYRFALEARKLNGGDVRLLVQGQTLSKDALAQLTLYPKTIIERAERALLLLGKVLQLIQGLGLTEREVRYLLTHAGDFGNLDLKRLPTQASDDTPEMARTLFADFLRLAGYARLKRDLAGGTEDIIGIFEAQALAPDKTYQMVARLTRRDQGTVKETAEKIFDLPRFTNELDLAQLWDALQTVERFGVPVASISGWTNIISAAARPDGFAIARDLKEAIKSRFDSETWQRIARPIFDKLRGRQRDALVAHVMHQHGFARIEQLYEYFLIDPGMEPVVQTSRVRLAIAAAQVFIQRCLLNLEKQVHPSAINAKQWEWMKRYRVWEANRKIFLYPENWLEPEFRDDKSHLFRELEGSLLQGDVSTDLVEDAFLNYLKKLEQLARLDIVAMHCEDKADPASNVLHVIGRTYTEPYNYFYRRYAHQMWSAWEPVTAEITGDHLAPVVWRDRLYLFWVTFLDRPDPNALPAGKFGTNVTELVTDLSGVDLALRDGSAKKVRHGSGAKSAKSSATPDPSSKPVTELAVFELAGIVKEANTYKYVEAQLHWSEYVQGEWTTSETGGFSNTLVRSVPLDFDPKSVFIHVSKLFDKNGDGEERGVKIHLGGLFNQAFFLAGRNSKPAADSREPEPPLPYSKTGVRATRYEGRGALKVTFTARIKKEDGKQAELTPDTQNILRQGGSYTLLPCDNAITLGTTEIASLVTPLFYQDNAEQTFFIEPSLTEKTIEEWQEWVTRTPAPEPEWDHPDWWKDKFVDPVVPKVRLPIPINPGDPVWQLPIGPEAHFEVKPRQDWLVNPATVLEFDGELVGPLGRAGLSILTPAEATGAPSNGAIPVNTHSGSSLTQGSTVVALESNSLELAGLTETASGLNVVGKSGLNSALLKNFAQSLKL